ncbi:MAG: PQQ-binding-like beta-propeller repeat protein [Gemmatimonadota bacterium]
MKAANARTGIRIAGVLIAVLAAPLAVHAQSSSATFTLAQATRGKAVYAEKCASCHGPSLTDGSAPALNGPAFQTSWSHPRVTLDDIFFLQRTTMPLNAASSVSPEDQAAVFAYILQANGYPAGRTPVSPGAPGLLQPPKWVSANPAGDGQGTAGETSLPHFIEGDAGAAPAANGPDQAALVSASGSTDWLLYTHDYSGSRYSPLSQINTANASELVPACAFQVGETDNFQTGPIVHDGTMYVTTWKSTIALDAATCRPKWRHTWEPLGYPGWQRNRGVALKDGRLFRGTPDGYLLALNAESGALLWARRVARSEDGETFSMAPLVYDDLVIIGPAGSENNIQGWVGAFRLTDGSPVWRFNTVPKPGEPGYETWHNPEGIPMGGGAVWTSFSLDPETGELYVAVTNPAPDLPVHLRQGDNLYTNSILDLDVRTGTLKWHRSLVPNDSHDWDLTHASPLITATVNGTPRRLVVTAGKDGILRSLDRQTHEVLYETPVTTLENQTTPTTTTPSRVCPGILGGVEWSGPAYHPGTNLLYVPAVDWCATFTAFEETRYIPGKNYLGGSVELDPAEKSQGWVTAVDASTGAVKWKYRSPRPMVASVTATAGNLLLTGELTGDFLALDAGNGEVLYRFNTGGPMGGGIVTYDVAGTQYIAAVSGSPSNFWVDEFAGSPTIVVFRLR